jgi:hypothetical protein
MSALRILNIGRPPMQCRELTMTACTVLSLLLPMLVDDLAEVNIAGPFIRALAAAHDHVFPVARPPFIARQLFAISMLLSYRWLFCDRYW